MTSLLMVAEWNCGTQVVEIEGQDLFWFWPGKGPASLSFSWTEGMRYQSYGNRIRIRVLTVSQWGQHVIISTLSRSLMDAHLIVIPEYASSPNLRQPCNLGSEGLCRKVDNEFSYKTLRTLWPLTPMWSKKKLEDQKRWFSSSPGSARSLQEKRFLLPIIIIYKRKIILWIVMISHRSPNLPVLPQQLL